jgi:hypothetical protein
VQQTADGHWQVELDSGHWKTCQSKNDVDLIAGSTLLTLENNPNQVLVRETLAAMDRNGITVAARLYRGVQAMLKVERGR